MQIHRRFGGREEEKLICDMAWGAASVDSGGLESEVPEGGKRPGLDVRALKRHQLLVGSEAMAVDKIII